MQNDTSPMEGKTQDDDEFDADRLSNSGDTETGGMGLDVAALGGGAAIAGDSLNDAGQTGPDIDGGSR